MESAYQQQIQTLKESTNAGILIGRPLQGRFRQLGGCPFPRVENPWLFKVSPFGAPAGHHFEPIGQLIAFCYGVQQKDMGHAQGSAWEQEEGGTLAWMLGGVHTPL